MDQSTHCSLLGIRHTAQGNWLSFCGFRDLPRGYTSPPGYFYGTVRTLNRPVQLSLPPYGHILGPTGKRLGKSRFLTSTGKFLLVFIQCSQWVRSAAVLLTLCGPPRLVSLVLLQVFCPGERLPLRGDHRLELVLQQKRWLFGRSGVRRSGGCSPTTTPGDCHI